MKNTDLFWVLSSILILSCSTVDTNNNDEADSTPEWVVYDTTNSDLVDNIINCIIIDRNDVKWIGTGRKGIVKYDGNTWIDLNSHVENIDMSSVWTLAFEDDLGFSGTSLIYAGDITGFTIYICDTTYYKDSTSVWDTVITYDTSNSDLPTGSITHICPISENRWLATNSYGLIKLNWLNELWYFTKENSSLPDNRIRAMAVDSSMKLWVGTKNGLVSILWEDWIIYDSSNTELLTDNEIKSISVDPDNRKWMVLGNDEVKVWADSISSFETISHTLFQKGIIKVHADQFGDVWFLINEGNILKKSGDDWELFNEETTGFSFLGGNNIAIDSKGAPWIGTISGIYTLK